MRSLLVVAILVFILLVNRDILDLIIATDEKEVKKRFAKDEGSVEASEEDKDVEGVVVSEDEEEEESRSDDEEMEVEDKGEEEEEESDGIRVDSESDDEQLIGEGGYSDDSMDVEDEDDEDEGESDDEARRLNGRYSCVHSYSAQVPALMAAEDVDHDASGEPPKKKRRTQGTQGDVDTEFGVARGVDFKNVSNVINFDFPLDVRFACGTTVACAC